MHTDPADQLRHRIALLQQRRKAIAGAVWAVAGLVIVFSLGTGTSLLTDHHVWWGIAWMPSIAADVALIVTLIGDQVLSESGAGSDDEAGRGAGIRTPGWGRALRYVAATVTLGLNTTAAVVDRDWVSVGIHGGIVVVLIAATEAAQAYVRSFGPELARLQTQLADLLAAATAAVERERAEQAAAVERERAAAAALRAEERAAEDAREQAAAERQRLLLEAQERASAAAQERASAEAAALLQRAETDRASAEAERARQERREQERQRRSEARRTPAPPPSGVRQADVLEAALKHHEKHGELPAESALLKQTGSSRATAWRALNEARKQLGVAPQKQPEKHEETQGLHLLPAAN